MENEESLWTDNKVVIFVSYKDQDADIALQIKHVLQQHGRIHVHVFKDTTAGLEYRDWIKNALQEAHIFLLVYTDLTTDWTWCLYEAGLFTPLQDGMARPLICLHPPHLGPPAPLLNVESVKAEPSDLLDRFLRPLYTNTQQLVSGIAHSVNEYLSEDTLRMIACHIAALMETKGLEPEYYDETIKITVSDPEVLQEEVPPDTLIEVAGGGERLDVLSLHKKQFTWEELCEQARDERGKGTFWVEEVANALKTAATGARPGVMTSTFRSLRGGRIYRPNLFRVDKVNGQPMIYYLLFNEELAPELQLNDDLVGKLFNLLRIGNRIRWEIVETFIKRLDRLALVGKEEDREKICQQVKESIQAVDIEAGRHSLFDRSTIDAAFSGDDRTTAQCMREKHIRLHKKIEAAIATNDVQQLRQLLECTGRLNHQFMALAARCYYEAVQSQANESYDQNEACHSIDGL